ncbi:hypothetical protein HY469_00210, partial [Candidatus Roizmanbacteria bacterium]|nr:hypothetical protein [Candidatus Roizmanbacteria bacterium]
LLIEINAISNKLNTINLDKFQYRYRGNLEWVDEIFKKEGINLPGHPLYRIESSLYVKNLPGIYQKIPLWDIKKAILLLNQKIDFINGHIEYARIQGLPRAYINPFKKGILGVCKDARNLAENIKRFLKDNFDIGEERLDRD